MSTLQRWMMGAGMLAVACPNVLSAEKATSPNIIFILCDDMGYGDLGCYGQKYIHTPNLDRMAQEGMLFTQAYAGSPVSAPSRASLMTGQHSGHGHVRGNKEYWPQAPTMKYGDNTEWTVVGQEPYDPQSGSRWDEVVKPISNGSFQDLLYKRWVKQRAADVEKWSNGRLGYVHIESMDDGSFRTVYSDILGKYNNCEGIVIDTRFNGGGRLHEDIEVLFSGKKYLTQVVRGREACDMPSRRWNKPSIMVQCEANYSNAHGTPWVYHYKQMGKLVGAPVPGTMTTVSWERLQDPSLVFGIPVVGYRTEDGSYLENKQLEPDIYVLNAPETIVEGEDTQLKAAVDELLKELK